MEIDNPYRETVRIYRAREDETGNMVNELFYEGSASIQQKNSSLSFGSNAIVSYYVAYLPNDRVVATPLDRLDWKGFNKDFSANEAEWNTIMKPSFNYEGVGTTIYFNEIAR